MDASFLTTVLQTPEKTLGYAVALAILGGIGWLISHSINTRTDRRRQQLSWQVEFTAKQLQELYGPLALLVTEGRQTFDDLLDVLNRDAVFVGSKPLTPDELQAWLFWVDNDFLPRNRQIQLLLASKPHLIEGPEVPRSYIEFLKHSSSWELAHRRWKEKGVEYGWHSKVNWPRSFEKD